MILQQALTRKSSSVTMDVYKEAEPLVRASDGIDSCTMLDRNERYLVKSIPGTSTPARFCRTRSCSPSNGTVLKAESHNVVSGGQQRPA